MSREDGVLVVVLTRKWFDMIEAGEKLEEYRGEHWAGRLLTGKGWETLKTGRPAEELDSLGWPERFHTYRTLRAFDGYRKGRRVLERKIRCIRWGTPRPEWSGDTVTGECFVIELEPIA